MKNYVLLYWCLLLPFISIGGGIELNNLGTKAAGMGGGITGYAIDGSSVFYNPAAISFLQKNYFNVGLSLVIPKTSFLGASGKEEVGTNQMYFPINFYATYISKNNLSFGLSVNNRFGEVADWDKQWSGRFLVQNIKVSYLDFQPTIAYKVNDSWSFGGGIIISRGNFQYNKAIPVESISNEASQELNGNGTGVGFNFGLFHQNEKLSYGISYRSGNKIIIKEGDADFINIPNSLVADLSYPISTTFQTKIELPSTLSLGLGYRIKESVLFTVDLSYNQWKSMENINIVYDDFSSLNSEFKNDFRNTFYFKTGVQFNANNKITLRGGFAFDQSPVQDGNLDPRFPDANKLIFSTGLSYQIKNNFSLDGSFLFADCKERKEQNKSDVKFNGTYKSFLYIIGIGLQYEF